MIDFYVIVYGYVVMYDEIEILVFGIDYDGFWSFCGVVFYYVLEIGWIDL